MSDDDPTWIGRRLGWGGAESEIAIRRADRRQHLYALGKTGTGKSTLLERLILQDIAAGEGVALLDPHGDLALRLLDHIPPWRTDDLAYFDPADLAYPIGFNILAAHPPERRHLAVSGVISAFKAIWRDSWGPRLEYILANAVAALTEIPGATLLHLPRLLADDGYRARVAEQIEDPVVRRFWREEFAGYDKRLRAEAIAPVQNKVGQFLMSPVVRNIFGQETSALDARFMMDRRRILIANLAKGRIGEDKASLIGALLVSSFELAASSRAAAAVEALPDFYLYADEFQNFATDSFASILSEARKYRLCLSLFHQFEDQLERLFASPRNRFDPFAAMNEGKIVLIHTAKDLLKRDGCQILGRFFIALIAQATLERAALPPGQRRPCFVYIDEAHEYFDDEIEDLLNQARKYRVGLVLAHQNLEQLSQRLRATIMASTSVKLAGGVSAKDAATLAREMGCEPEFIQAARKRGRHTEFACWVKNATPRALKLTVPLGVLEGLPRLGEGDYQALLAANRTRYAATAAAAWQDRSQRTEQGGFRLGEHEVL